MKFILNLTIAISCVVCPFATTAQTPVLLRTFHNPTPAIDDNFGSSMAALGNDRVLIGARYDDTSATNAGAVYLFHTNGTLLTTFTNPIPALIFPYGDEQFGSAVATLGNDRVVVGSPMVGKVFLFAANGTLLTTLNSSNFYDVHFGNAVAAVGNDRVLIGARGAYPDNQVYTEAGAAYLYSTNGAHLMTFANPYVDYVFEFGSSVVALSNDRVLISAESYGSGFGAVFLFNTNGTLLTTITNPAPGIQNYFGHSIAAVSADRVLVGAPHLGNTVGNTNPGSVYVFNTNGTLLATITNPTPVVSDYFGDKLATLGNDRVLISASGDDTGATDAGSAYVYSVNGTLLATLSNPAPADYDRFGHRLAAFGSQGAIIGAMYEDTGASMAGSAYLFGIPSSSAPPSLSIQRTTTNTMVVSWPAAVTGFVPQQNTNGLSSLNWSNVTATLQDDGTNQTCVVDPTNQRAFFRLRTP
jgi:hypothetical protein